MTSKKKRQITTTFIAAGFIALIFAGTVFFLASKIDSLNSEIDRLRSSLFDEVESHYTALQAIHSGTALMAEDLRETREMLQLSVEEYGLKEELFGKTGDEEAAGESGLSDNGSKNNDSLFYQAVDHIERSEERRGVQKAVANFFTGDGSVGGAESPRSAEASSGRIPALLEEKGIEFAKNGALSWQVSSSTFGPFVKITASKKSDSHYSVSLSPRYGEPVSLRLPIASYSFSDGAEEKIVSLISRSLRKNEEHLRVASGMIKEIEEMLDSPGFRRNLKSKELQLDPPPSSPIEEGDLSVFAETKKILWSITNPGSGRNISFGLDTEDLKYFIDTDEVSTTEEKSEAESANSSFDTFTDTAPLSEAVESAISEIEPEAEKNVEHSLERIRALGRDEAFNAFLEKRNLELSGKPREGTDHFYFDLRYTAETERAGERFGSFAVHSKNGKIYFVDSEEVVISSLATIDRGVTFTSPESDESDGKLPTNFPGWEKNADAEQEGRVIILYGIHEKNADSIIIAYLEKNTVKMLSLPRDLYYRKRKLASYYQAYGPERLSSVISEITGLTVDGYLSVDMYAFIEIIDILGGIEVNLEEALIDPTYRIREDGIWKTLYYPAGTHQLSGIEALRIARSRHTSDDFDRSKRQQLVIASLKDKLNTLHAGKIDKLKNIFSTLFTYIHTDYSLMEAVRLFAMYHDARMESLEGVSTDNVLYATYSNLHRLEKKEEEVGEDFPKGAWILMPKEDNWDAVKWYVNRRLLEKS